jgi:hypothetical protein
VGVAGAVKQEKKTQAPKDLMDGYNAMMEFTGDPKQGV